MGGRGSCFSRHLRLQQFAEVGLAAPCQHDGADRDAPLSP